MAAADDDAACATAIGVSPGSDLRGVSGARRRNR